MLSINPIARVVVNTFRAAANPVNFDTGLLMILDSTGSYTSDRRLNAYTGAEDAVAALLEYGFAETSGAVKSVVKYFAATPAPSKLLISCYPSGDPLSDVLEDVLNMTTDFYGVMPVDTISKANMLSFAQYIEALSVPLMLFVPVTGVAGAVVANDGILAALHDAKLKRSFPFYCESNDDCAAVMGTAMGLELAHQASAFSLFFKTINGIQPSTLTESQVGDIEALGGNVYIVRGYTHYGLEKGTVSSGVRYDEVLYLDEIAADLQNAAIGLIAENPDKLPQTDDSTAQFINKFTAILFGYTGRNILASAAWRGADTGPLHTGDVVENGFALWADSYDDQSDADRAAHKAVPISVGLVMAGSIESIVITVNVTV